jgi:hypothetical protein
MRKELLRLLIIWGGPLCASKDFDNSKLCGGFSGIIF